MKRHNLKIYVPHFRAQIAGVKNFELRRNDRDFMVDDEIKLNEIYEGKSTGNSCLVRITYILESVEGLAVNYLILGTELIYTP